MFQKDMRISLLLDFYGDILSERKREIIDYYYNDDLSLAEIADETGISRQGVRDYVKKAERELITLEEKLGLAERFGRVSSEISSLAAEIDNMISVTDNETEKNNLIHIKEKLEKIEI